MNIRLIPPLMLIVMLGACGDAPDNAGAKAEGAAEAAAEEFERGPHRGRLLRDGDFALEVTIFETGVPPQFRLYAYRADQPLPPGEVQASMQLTRLGGKVDRFSFTAEGDALASPDTVIEPHSFDVVVTATEGGRQHRWEYASYEGRTTIAAAIAESSGVRTELAAAAKIRSTITLLGSVNFDANRVAQVRARFPGIVRDVRVAVGEAVARGAVLAMVEGNESMRSYPITAPIAGFVTARNTNVGDVTGDAALFEISDLSSVWVDLHVFGRDIAQLKAGQPVTVRSTVADISTSAKLDRLLPIATAGSQSAIARLRLANPEGQWRPGLAVSAEVTVAEYPVALAVKTAALQPFRDFTVVYAQVGETYEVRMLELGRADPDYTEVKSGLDPGTRYVSEQAFLIRADVEKSGASHDH
jgi:cobalt-zinc-cadmium efflux system membrane fusion protein